MKRTPEQRFLWEMMKSHYGTAGPIELERLIKQCNMDILKELTALTGIEGFLYSICSVAPFRELVPEEYRSFLQQRTGIAAIKNNFVYQNGLEIIQLFNDHHIDYIMVKGIVILKQLYDEQMMRAVSDLDIVISRKSYPAVRELLLREGFYYSQEILERQNLLLTLEEYETVSHEISYFKDTPPFPTSLDLHFNLSGFSANSKLHRLYPIDRHDWFGNVCILEADGSAIRCLNHEMALLHMIYHFSIHHSFRNLKWLLDICQMVVKYNDWIDWCKVYQAAAHPNLRKLVGICLAMVTEITGIDRFGEYDLNDFIKSNINIGMYQNMVFADIDKMKARIGGRLVRLSLPVSCADKIQVLGYDLFDRDSIIHRTGTRTRTGIDLLQPFRVIGLTLKDRLNNKK